MARVIEQFFDSPEAMTATSGLMTSASGSRWRGRMRSLQVDGVRADYVDLDPYRLEVPPLRDRLDRPVQMMLSIILEGASEGVVGGHALTLRAKEAAILDGRAPMEFRSVSRVRALRLFVEEDHLPTQALGCASLPFARLKPTPLVTGCIGLIGGLLQVDSHELEPHEEVAVSQPLIAMMAGLLNETLHEAATRTGSRSVHESEPLDRRERIERLIRSRLGESDLNVASIAAALGVHIRTVHLVYADSGDTVTGRIRAMRVARAQALLRLREDPPNTRLLAARVGLTPEQLTRAFLTATGLTPRRWWERHRAEGLSRTSA